MPFDPNFNRYKETTTNNDVVVGQRVFSRRAVATTCRAGEIGVVVKVQRHPQDENAKRIFILFQEGGIVGLFDAVFRSAISVSSFVDFRLKDYTYLGEECTRQDLKDGIFLF
jgi:hypothetical protein